MITKKFQIQVKKSNENINLIFSSKTNTNLIIRDLKAFESPNKVDLPFGNLIFPFYLDNTSKTIPLNIKSKIYKSVTFIVKDTTHKEQYAVSIVLETLDTEGIKYTPMLFGE